MGGIVKGAKEFMRFDPLTSGVEDWNLSKAEEEGIARYHIEGNTMVENSMPVNNGNIPDELFIDHKNRGRIIRDLQTHAGSKRGHYRSKFAMRNPAALDPTDARANKYTFTDASFDEIMGSAKKIYSGRKPRPRPEDASLPSGRHKAKFYIEHDPILAGRQDPAGAIHGNTNISKIIAVTDDQGKIDYISTIYPRLKRR